MGIRPNRILFQHAVSKRLLQLNGYHEFVLQWINLVILSFFAITKLHLSVRCFDKLFSSNEGQMQNWKLISNVYGEP